MDPIDILLGLGIAYLVWAMISPSIVPQVVTDTAGGIVSKTYSAAVQAIAKAWSVAEGYGPAGNIPTRANNPGDLKNGDIGYGTLGEGITVYPTPEAGWAALYHQVDLMFGGSHVYTPDMTIRQVSQLYVNGKPVSTAQSENWAVNASGALGVSPDTTLNDVAAMHV